MTFFMRGLESFEPFGRPRFIAAFGALDTTGATFEGLSQYLQTCFALANAVVRPWYAVANVALVDILITRGWYSFIMISKLKNKYGRK